VNRIDATVLQPDVAAPDQDRDRGVPHLQHHPHRPLQQGAFSFFQAIEGLEGQDYEFAPDGFTTGDQKIAGLCNVLSVEHAERDAGQRAGVHRRAELHVAQPSAPTNAVPHLTRARSRRGRSGPGSIRQRRSQDEEHHFPLKPGEIDVEFRFTFKTARQLELSAGCNFQTLLARGQQVEAVAQLTCFALRHDDKTMTIEKAVDLIDAYIEKGGDIVKLYLALQEAMNHSGVLRAGAEG
jgi:hypothetical protein